ncbi:MAG: proline racemase family protein [Planctomycetota bacterium]
MPNARTLTVIDSHTGGEPTRVVVDGLPPLETNDPAAVRDQLRSQHDWVRTSLTHEPFGAPWMVGAAMLPPVSDGAAAGVVFFNNTGYLGMCGHGLIGLVATLRHMRRIEPGTHRFDTPAGLVTARLHEDESVSFRNVPSFRLKTGVVVESTEFGRLEGDIAYGGNWFYLASVPALDPAELDRYTRATRQIKLALSAQGVTGPDGEEVDHIELFAPPSGPECNSRNFVLCPGDEYDRSPCGTGLSAKLACQAADDALPPGEEWVQESITGSRFRGSYEPTKEGVLPTIRGSADVVAECRVFVETGVAAGAIDAG